MIHVSMDLLIRNLALEQHGCNFFERDAYAALVEIDRASETFVFLGGWERDGRLDPSSCRRNWKTSIMSIFQALAEKGSSSLVFGHGDWGWDSLCDSE